MKNFKLWQLSATLGGYTFGIVGSHFGFFPWPGAVFVTLGLWLIVTWILFYKEVLRDR